MPLPAGQGAGQKRKIAMAKEQPLRKSSPIVSLAVFTGSLLMTFLINARSVLLPTALPELDAMQFYGVMVILNSMSMAIALPVAGKLGELFGRRRVLLAGALISIGGNLLCTLAANGYMLMAGIASNGVGVGVINAVQVPILCELYDEQRRPKMISYMVTCNALAALVAPTVAGLLVDGPGWRWIYFSAIPMGLLILVITWVFYHPVYQRGTDISIDYLGIFFFTLCVMPFLYGLTAGGSTYPWLSLPMGLLMGGAACALVALVLTERRAKSPIIPGHLLKEPVFLTTLCVALLYNVANSVVNYLPLFYQGVMGLSATESGLLVVPRSLAQMGMTLLAGRYLSRSGRYRAMLLTTLVVLGGSLLHISTFTAMTATFLVIGTEIFLGGANGAQQVTVQSFCPTILSEREMGQGMAFLNFMTSFGVSFGSAIGGSCINQFWNLDKLVPPALRSALDASQLSALKDTNFLKNSAAIRQMAQSLPAELQSVFDQTVQSLKLALNQGVETFCFIYVGCVLLAVGMVIFLLGRPAAAQKQG